MSARSTMRFGDNITVTKEYRLKMKVDPAKVPDRPAKVNCPKCKQGFPLEGNVREAGAPVPAPEAPATEETPATPEAEPQARPSAKGYYAVDMSEIESALLAEEIPEAEEEAEEAAKVLAEETFAWLEESAKLSATPYDDMALFVLPSLLLLVTPSRHGEERQALLDALRTEEYDPHSRETAIDTAHR